METSWSSYSYDTPTDSSAVTLVESPDRVAVNRPSPRLTFFAAEDGLGAGFDAPETYPGRQGQLTDGSYTLHEPGMAPHMAGSGSSGKCQSLSTVDADTATLDAGACADKNGLWVGNTAKVYVENGPVGVVGRTGQLTNWINIYRTNSGFIHGTPGNAP